jgi:hypothetical protein
MCTNGSVCAADPLQAGGFAYAIAGFKCLGFNILTGAVAMAPPNLADLAIADINFFCTLQYAFRQNDWPNLSGQGTVNVQARVRTGCPCISRDTIRFGWMGQLRHGRHRRIA